MKSFNQMQVDHINKNYKEYRGVLCRKYRNIFGKYVFVIDENGSESKIYVGKGIFDITETGAKLTVGALKRKLVNIRPGFCENTDE